MFIGLILGLENHPLAVKKDSLSLPSGKDTQAVGAPVLLSPRAWLGHLALSASHDTDPSPNHSSKKNHQQKNVYKVSCPESSVLDTLSHFILKRTLGGGALLSVVTAA